MKFLKIALVTFAFQAPLALGNPNNTEGAAKFRDYNCTSCHGPNGLHPILSTYPIIGGQSKDYVVLQLKEMRSGARAHGNSKIMISVAKSIAESEYEVIADYLASVKPVAPKDSVALTGKGADAYKSRNCHTCHGDVGKTPIVPNYPVLAGQNPLYALSQMRAIKSGERSSGMSMVMKALVAEVPDDELIAIAEYLHSVR